MSKLSEDFFKIDTWEEFDRRREEFRELKIKEPGVWEHMKKILPDIKDGVKDGIIHEVF